MLLEKGGYYIQSRSRRLPYYIKVFLEVFYDAI